MKQRLLPLLIAFLLLLTACGTDTPQTTEAPTEALQNSQTEGATGQSSLQPLALEIPAEERCAMTSNCTLAETDAGYYMIRQGYLFYADKTDLSNWVLVCNQADCSHQESLCPAYLNSLCGFWVENDGIYYVSNTISRQDLDGYHFIKMGLDGSSPQAVYTDPNLNGNYSGGGSLTEAGIKDSFCRCITTMQEDGNWNCSVVQVDSQGAKILFSATYPSSSNGSIPLPWTYNLLKSVRGDVIINSKIPLDGTPDENKEDWASRESNLYYQVHNDTIRELDLPETCDLYGAYISGDSLWHYHMNDGFYYMDLSTGEEVKIADATYENAYGHCIDGKHMVECSLSVPGYTRDAIQPQMRYFDGEVWHELELPEYWNTNYSFRVWAATSDRIIFTVDDYNERQSDSEEELGYIILGKDMLTICDKYPYLTSFD